MTVRKLALLALLLGGCAADDGRDVRYIADFAANAKTLACSNAPSPLADLEIGQLVTTTAGSVLAVLPEARMVALLNDRLEVEWRMNFDKAGPLGVAKPISAAVIDSVLYVVDQQLPLIKRFTLAGARRPDIHLDFAPLRLEAARDILIVVPAIIGRYPSALLYVWRGAEVVAQPIAPVEFPDVALKMLANALTTAVSDEHVLLLHQVLTPRAFVWRLGQQFERRPVPLPRDVRKAVGYVPPLPLDEAALKPALAVGLAASGDPRRGQFVFLTRSGRKVQDRFEKALIRTDLRLGFIDAFILPLNAGHFALLHTRDLALVVDEENRWYTCPLL